MCWTIISYALKKHAAAGKDEFELKHRWLSPEVQARLSYDAQYACNKRNPHSSRQMRLKPPLCISLQH